MGLFDYVNCKYPLPVDGSNEREYQTKDTPSQYMDRYEIREDGQLWFIEHGAEKPVFCPMTGEIRFYTSVGHRPYLRKGESDGWIEFSSYFVNGILKEVHLIENSPSVTLEEA